MFACRRFEHLRVEERVLLLELGEGNAELHELGWLVDLAVVDHLEAVENDGLHGGLALATAGE